MENEYLKVNEWVDVSDMRSCGECRALVLWMDTDGHTAWHERLARLEQALQAAGVTL